MNAFENIFEGQEWLSATLNSIGDAVIATSAAADPIILFMNPAAERMTGWNFDEAVGRNALQIFQIINQTSRESAKNPIESVLREGQPVDLVGPAVLIAKNSREFVIEGSAAPIRNNPGQIKGVVVIFRDVTAKILAEEKAQKLSREVEWAREDLYGFFMQAPIPMVIMLGPDHRFVLANEPYERFVGRKVVGKTVAEAFRPEEASPFIPILDRVYKTGKPWIGKAMPLNIPDQNGEMQTHFVNFGYHPYVASNGTIQGILAIVIDVTEETLARHAIEKSKAAVENERENFRNLFRLSPEVVCILKGPDHVFEFVNEAHIETLGFDATGQSVHEAQPESVEVHGILDRVFRTGETALLHEIPVTVGDRIRYFNVTYAARRDESGTIDGIMILGSEVTAQVLARTQLVRSEANFRELADALPVIVWTATPDGFVDWYNAWWYQYLGLPRGTRWDDPATLPMHPDDVERTNALWYEVVAAGQPFHMEQRFRRGSDGQYRWHLVRGVPIRDANGRLIRYVGANTDIHDQKMLADELQAAQSKLQTALQGAGMGAWYLDLASGKITYSEGTAAILGMQVPADDLAEFIETHIHPDDQEARFMVLERCLRNREDYADEFRIFDSAGNIRFIISRARLLDDSQGNPYALTGIVMDVTERKQLEASLLQAKEAAEAANATKTSFLANMSHEIRTPLGAIIGFADLLKDEDLAREERTQFVETISRNAKALTRIIDDILDLAKVEAGRLDVEEIEFSLVDLIQEVMNLFEDKARQKGIELQFGIEDDTPRRIISDPTRIRQILINLVGNAVKFTTRGSVGIQVASAWKDQDRAQFEIKVRDTGIGLTSSQQEKLFEPFVQADNSTTRKYGGTGLGLVLSRRLANALGGNITISDCHEGQGCTFIMTFVGGIPVRLTERLVKKESEPFRVPNKPGQKQRLARVKVLLADDSSDNQFLVSRVLKTYGATVAVANDGEEAIEKALSSEFDLVLMDIQMPRVDGYEAARALRLNGYTKPIIALTAHAMVEERARTRAAGCNSHLTKPLNSQELIETIEKFVYPRRLQEVEQGKHL
ncbi:PAS domain-containing protein [Oligoflexus tunisiensis]|uniref:PAS domain-containing protein n=1 Tax=Oligoflexus tunisiensis TaxID=708132 RepID=UPI001C403D5A|nr:PAS domain-containing protein [Oligoflexus tunisiensis]